MSDRIKVALVGNPNTGKTSLFNHLTGLNQKVGNYPGVTVDKKQGTCTLSKSHKAIITDLPGTYSINPTSEDESIVFRTLFHKDVTEYPDVLVVVADVENLKRNLLLFSQIKDGSYILFATESKLSKFTTAISSTYLLFKLNDLINI